MPGRVTLAADLGRARAATAVATAVAAVVQLLLRFITRGKQDHVVDVVTLVKQGHGAGGVDRRAEGSNGTLARH